MLGLDVGGLRLPLVAATTRTRPDPRVLERHGLLAAPRA